MSMIEGGPPRCLWTISGPVPTAAIAGGSGASIHAVPDPQVAAAVLAPSGAGPTPPIAREAPISFRDRLCRLLESLPSLKVLVENEMKCGEDLASLEGGVILSHLENGLSKELASSVHNLSDARLALYTEMLTVPLESEDQDILAHLIKNGGHRENGLSGLLIGRWHAGDDAQEALQSWMERLFPEIKDELTVPIGSFVSGVSTALAPLQIPARGLIEIQAQRLADEVEADLIDVYHRIDDLVESSFQSLKQASASREVVLGSLLASVAFLQAKCELQRAVLAEVLRDFPSISVEVSAERHNVNALLTMVYGLIFLSSSERDLSTYERIKDTSLNQAWQRPLQDLAFLDLRYQTDTGGACHYQGRIPQKILQRYKINKVPDGSSLLVDIVVDSDVHDLRPQKQFGKIFPFMELRKLFVNLFSNALKYCNLGEAEPRLQVKISSMNPDQVAIFVSDNGLGIADVDRALGGSRLLQGEAGGGGEGLAWVKRMVESLGGTLVIESSLPSPPTYLGGKTRHAILFPRTMFQ